MAKGSKNEILLSIALEGDDEIKKKLKAVGDEGKKSLSDIERAFSAASRPRGGGGEGGGRNLTIPGIGNVGNVEAAVGRLRGAIAPLLEGAGLARLGGLAGGTEGAGLLGRLFGVAGPAAAVAALAAIGSKLSALREESEKTQSRLKGFGAGKSAFEDLNTSAKKLGVSASDLAPILESRAAARRRIAEQGSPNVIRPPGVSPDQETPQLPPVFSGGRLVSGGSFGTNKDILEATGTLLNASKLDKVPKDVALGAIREFFESADSVGGVNADAIRKLAQTSPAAANQFARSVGAGPLPLTGPGVNIGGGFRNFEDLATKLERNDAAIGQESVFRPLAKDLESSAAAARAARGPSDAAEGLSAGFKRLEDSFSESAGGVINKSITADTDKISGFVDAAAGSISAHKDLIEQGADLGVRGIKGIPLIGSIPGIGLIGGTAGSIGGALAGGASDLIDAGAARSSTFDSIVKGVRSGAGTVGSFLSDAFTNPGALTEKQRPTEGASALEPIPVQPVPPQAQFEQSTSAFDTFIQGLNAKLNSINAPDTKVQEPVQGIGVRGDLQDGQDSSKNVASTVNEVDGSLKQLAAAIGEAVGAIQSAASSAGNSRQSGEASAEVAVAGGGMVRRLDGGGHVMGPGTSTSDSIPAMLSDGEYVIKASSARKLGRDNLDWLNAGHFADGGPSGGASGGLSDAIALSELARKRNELDRARKKERARLFDVALKDQRDILRANNDPYGDGSSISHGLAITPRDLDPGFASGGAVGRLWGGIKRFANGGLARLAGGGRVSWEEWSDPNLTPEESLDLVARATLSGTALNQYYLNQERGKADLEQMNATSGAFGSSSAAAGRATERGFVRPEDDRIGHFASGGSVKFGDSIGHLFSGGSAADMPALGDLSGGAAEALHPVTINFEGRPVAGLRAPGGVVDSLRREARDSTNFQTGPSPSWAHGGS